MTSKGTLLQVLQSESRKDRSSAAEDLVFRILADRSFFVHYKNKEFLWNVWLGTIHSDVPISPSQC